MNWLRDKFRRSHADEQLDREIAFHIDELTRDNIGRGMTSTEARRQAVLQFGGAEQVKQQLREVHLSAVIEGFGANLRSAMRFIRRAPLFAFAVIMTLALGIGANSAVFSAIDAILLRPLPFPHGGELIRFHQRDFKHKNPETFVAPLRLEDWNRMNSSFQSISGYYTGDATLTSGSLPEKASVAFVAPRFLQLWGISPALGRDFSDEEWRFGGPSAVLISDRFWRTHLQSDPQAVGKALRLSKSSYTIVGVLPASFLFPDRDVDLWEPNAVDAPYSQDRNSTWFRVIGRLKPGRTLAEAQADLATVQIQLGRQFPKSDGDLTVQLQPLKAAVLGSIQGSLWLVYGAVSLLLLIACTNIAALLMARTTEREHEISIRYSLGARRSAIIGQLLTEVFVLALSGALLGLTIAAGAGRVFARFAKELPRADEIRLNWHIVAYSLGCALAVTLLCGLFPAIRGTSRSLLGSLSHASRTQVSARNSWQWTLVGVQVSLAVALLIASGLLLRSFQALGGVDPGFDPHHVLTLRVSGSLG
jgi:putative ABC transport system permease protein